MSPSESIRNESFYQVNTAKRQQEVLATIQKLGGSATNAEISKEQGQPINRITGRITELVELGLVVFDKKVFDHETNRHVSKWRLTDKQLTLF